jgi:hypothetical protein
MCIDFIFQSLSLNVRRLVSLQEIMTPIQSTFLSFRNEFHGNSIPSFHISNVNELGLNLLTKWSRDLYTCTNSIFQYLFSMKRLTSLQGNMGPIHSTFYSFCNEFHENSLQWIHNWKGEQKNEWLNELGLMLLTKWSTYMVCIHVQLHLSISITPRGRFHYKEIWAQLTQHSHSSCNEFPIEKVNNKWMIEWTKIGAINHVRYTICTHVAFLFSLSTNTYKIEKYNKINLNK